MCLCQENGNVVGVLIPFQPAAQEKQPHHQMIGSGTAKLSYKADRAEQQAGPSEALHKFPVDTPCWMSTVLGENATPGVMSGLVHLSHSMSLPGYPKGETLQG